MVKGMKLVLASTHHSPGSTLQGKLIVSVDKPKFYDSIVVTLWGGANVQWQENRTNCESYVHKEAVVWKAENSTTCFLPAGEYHFLFSFELPRDIPSSFEGQFGNVRYMVMARIVRSGGLIKSLKPRQASTVRLAVQDRTPRMDILRWHNQTMSKSKTNKRLGFPFLRLGHVSATVTVPRVGFSPGDTIPITVNVSNQSSRQVCVAAALKRRDIFTSSEGIQRKSYCLVSRTSSPPILPGVTTTYEDTNLKIPATAYVTIKECSFINSKYVLEILVKIPLSLDTKMLIPIVIVHSDSSSVREPIAWFSSQLRQDTGTSFPQPPPYSEHFPQVIPQREQKPDPFLPSYNEAIGKHDHELYIRT